MTPLNSSGKFPEVLGYITEPERIALQACVLSVSKIPGDAFEVGSLNGLSALLTLSVLPSHKDFLCIEKGQVETLCENLTKYGLGEKAGAVCQDFKSMEIAAEFCFGFIDHDHTYENTMAAFDKFWPLISKGGVLAFHDYGHPDYPGGTKAIDEIIEDGNKHGAITIETTGSIIFFGKL